MALCGEICAVFSENIHAVPVSDTLYPKPTGRNLWGTLVSGWKAGQLNVCRHWPGLLERPHMLHASSSGCGMGRRSAGTPSTLASQFSRVFGIQKWPLLAAGTL